MTTEKPADVFDRIEALLAEQVELLREQMEPALDPARKLKEGDPYTLVEYGLDQERNDLPLSIIGRYLLAITDGSFSGIEVRVGKVSNQRIPLQYFNGISFEKPFKQLFLTWPAQVGKKLQLYVGRRSNSGSGFPALSNPASVSVPILKKGRLSTASSDYAAVVTWTVATGKSGVLSEVAFITNTPGSTQWKVTIDGTEQFTNEYFQAPFGAPFGSNEFASGAVIQVLAKSADGSTVVCDAAISGTES